MNDKPAIPLTVQAVERFDRHPETARRRRALLEARDKARQIREHVDSYILPLFQTFHFVRSGRFAGARAGKPIACPEDLYLTEQEDEVSRFYAACDDEHRAHGYEVSLPGFCPARSAEHAVVEAEHELLLHASRMLGIDFQHCYGDLRVRALEILESGPAAPVNTGKRRAARRRGRPSLRYLGQ